MTNTSNNPQPLYKVLNAARQDGIWKAGGIASSGIYSSVGLTTKSGDWIGRMIVNTHKNKETAEANAQYAALAVNSLHILADALERLIKAADGSNCDSIAVDNAKAALQAIS